MLFRNHVFSLILLAILVFSSFIIFANNVYAEDEFVEYKVMQNDTLTKVLKRHSLKPIYGKTGSLAEALKLNPKKQNTHGNLIFIGEILILPKNMDQVNIIEHKKPTQASIKKEKKKIDLVPNEEMKKENKIKPNNQEKSKHSNALKESEKPKETFKKPEQQPKMTEKVSQKKPEQPFKPESNKNVEKSNVFIPNNQTNSEKETVDNSNHQNNKSNSQTEYLTFSKTQLPALPLKPDNIQASKESIEVQKQDISLSPEMEYDFLLDTSSFCNPNPSCRNWLWEPESKCCKPVKRYFLFYEKDSL